MKNKIWILCMSFLLIILSIHPVMAADNLKGSIQLNAYIEKGNSEKYLLKDVSFELYQLTKITEGVETFLEAYSEYQVMPNWNDAQELQTLARSYQTFIKRKNIEGTKIVTSPKGIATFEDLEEGLYVIWQSKDAVVDRNVYRSSPMLVHIPSYDGNEKNLHVLINPKFENEKLPIINEKPPGKVQTSDELQMEKYILIILVCILVISVSCFRYKNFSEHK